MGSRAVAILLAVFFGPFTWLYTYDEDKTKFWLGLIGSTVGWILILPPFIVWIWSIVDQATKSSDYFENL